MPRILDQRVFVPTKDLQTSLDFYEALGWECRYRDSSLALVECGASHLLLQAYYQEGWASNMMIHFWIDDVQDWYRLVQQVVEDARFHAAVLRAPHPEPYGATVMHVMDPAGVLLHFAERDADEGTADGSPRLPRQATSEERGRHQERDGEQELDVGRPRL